MSRKILTFALLNFVKKYQTIYQGVENEHKKITRKKVTRHKKT